MQVFLPYENFEECARVLDMRRLGKQRVECKQILQANCGQSKGWVNHPVTRMWRGYEYCICKYAIAICSEWRGRGYKDSLLAYFKELEFPESVFPWLGCEEFHMQYRRILIRKDVGYYSKYFGNIEPQDKLEYERFL